MTPQTVDDSTGADRVDSREPLSNVAQHGTDQMTGSDAAEGDAYARRHGADGDAYARRLEAVAAGHRGEAAAAERLLDDDDAGVRAAALGAVARCGALRPEQVRQALGDTAAAVRRRAAELAPPDVGLVGLLSDPEASVVEAAAAALGERDRDAGPVGELCRVARSHDDPLCRESAVAALGAVAAGLDAEAAGPAASACPPAAADALRRAVPGLSHGAGAHEIGPGLSQEAGPHEAAPAMAHETRAHEAARATALETLLAAIDDRPQIRRRALLGLHQFDDDRAARAVHAALEDRDRQMRAIAGELLGVPVR